MMKLYCRLLILCLSAPFAALSVEPSDGCGFDQLSSDNSIAKIKKLSGFLSPENIKEGWWVFHPKIGKVQFVSYDSDTKTLITKRGNSTNTYKNVEPHFARGNSTAERALAEVWLQERFGEYANNIPELITLNEVFFAIERSGHLPQVLVSKIKEIQLRPEFADLGHKAGFAKYMGSVVSAFNSPLIANNFLQQIYSETGFDPYRWAAAGRVELWDTERSGLTNPHGAMDFRRYLAFKDISTDMPSRFDHPVDQNVIEDMWNRIPSNQSSFSFSVDTYREAKNPLRSKIYEGAHAPLTPLEAVKPTEATRKAMQNPDKVRAAALNDLIGTKEQELLNFFKAREIDAAQVVFVPAPSQSGNSLPTEIAHNLANRFAGSRVVEDSLKLGEDAEGQLEQSNWIERLANRFHPDRAIRTNPKTNPQDFDNKIVVFIDDVQATSSTFDGMRYAFYADPKLRDRIQDIYSFTLFRSTIEESGDTSNY